MACDTADDSLRRVVTIEPTAATGFNRRYATRDGCLTELPALKRRPTITLSLRD